MQYLRQKIIFCRLLFRVEKMCLLGDLDKKEDHIFDSLETASELGGRISSTSGLKSQKKIKNLTHTNRPSVDKIRIFNHG